MPDFNALQNAIDTRPSDAIEYFVFDLPFHDGRDLRQVPLRARRALLSRSRSAARPSDRIRLSQSFPAAPAQMLEAAARMQLEGIIVKRPDAPYVSARSETWLKLKCSLRQEFVVCGFTDRANAARRGRQPAPRHLRERRARTPATSAPAGTRAPGATCTRASSSSRSPTPLFDAATIKPGRWSRRTAGGERWVKPELVAEVVVSRVDARRPRPPRRVPGPARSTSRRRR